MKKIPQESAFTLIELIFVIVIIGIIAGVGASSFKTHYLLNDTNFIIGKIREAQYRGIGYEHNGFGSESTVADYERGCILLKDENLSDKDYRLHVTLDGELKDKIVCFDAKGRPHSDDFTEATLISEQKVLILKYKNQENNISIQPFTGYAIIKHN